MARVTYKTTKEADALSHGPARVPHPGLGEAGGGEPVAAGTATSPAAVLCQDEAADQ